MIENSEKITKIMQVLHKSNSHGMSLRQHITNEKDRFKQFSRSFDGILLDFSRTAMDLGDFENLMELASASGVETLRERMYQGARINFTENRAVLHPLWRERNFSDLLAKDEAELLADATNRLREIAHALHQGRLPGEAGQGRIRHLIHVGIGGSLLGPRLLCEAFPPTRDCPQIHFLASVDALERERLPEGIDARETAVMLVSKSFTTTVIPLDFTGVVNPEHEDREAQHSRRNPRPGRPG